MKQKVVDVQLLMLGKAAAVFDALTDPAAVMLWWQSPDFYRVTQFEMQPSSGGKWFLKAEGYDGKSFAVEGKVLEFDRPRVLAFTWNPSYQEIGTTNVRITLTPSPEGVLVRLVHSGFRSDSIGHETHLCGWPHVLRWLAGFLD